MDIVLDINNKKTSDIDPSRINSIEVDTGVLFMSKWRLFVYRKKGTLYLHTKNIVSVTWLCIENPEQK